MFVFCWKKNYMEEEREVCSTQRGKTIAGLDSECRVGKLFWVYKKQEEKSSLCSLGWEYVVKRLEEQLETFDFTQAKFCNRRNREAGD